jgi:hypothetical protein
LPIFTSLLYLLSVMSTLRIAAEAARHAVEQLRHSIALLKSMRVDAAGDQAQIDAINTQLADIYARVRNIGESLSCLEAH